MDHRHRKLLQQNRTANKPSTIPVDSAEMECSLRPCHAHLHMGAAVGSSERRKANNCKPDWGNIFYSNMFSSFGWRRINEEEDLIDLTWFGSVLGAYRTLLTKVKQ